jgi:hypothetical protein
VKEAAPRVNAIKFRTGLQRQSSDDWPIHLMLSLLHYFFATARMGNTPCQRVPPKTFQRKFVSITDYQVFCIFEEDFV